jgi:hypothetical protein
VVQDGGQSVGGPGSLCRLIECSSSHLVGIEVTKTVSSCCSIVINETEGSIL